MKEQLHRFFGRTEKSAHEEVKSLPVGEIIASPFQPRDEVDEQKIDDLSLSFKTHGVIQPIIVRLRDGKYELIAGERRFRAAMKLGWETIPGIIREMSDPQAASTALIENLQREDLTPLEEAQAYAQLMGLHALTQESLAQRLGKSQSAVANKIRLLQLSEPVKEALQKRRITERHARSLLVLTEIVDQQTVLQDILKYDLNVKQTEIRIKQAIAHKNESDAEEAKKPVRTVYSKDVRLAVNTVRQSIQMVQQTGMKVETTEEEYDDRIEITIRIPKNAPHTKHH
jgi:ParB family chromosome partitioning protein